VAADAQVPAVLAALVAAVPPVVLVATTHLTVQHTHRPMPAATAGLALRADMPALHADHAERGAQGSATRGRPRELPGAVVAAHDERDAGEAVREALRLREHGGLTNRQIAARLGVHPSTVGRWLKAPPAHQPAPTADRDAGPRPALPEATQTTQEQSAGKAATERSPTP
jgi:hypothetical protein